MSLPITRKVFTVLGCSLLALGLALGARWLQSAAAAIPGAAGDGVVSPSSGAYAAHIDIDIPDYYDLEPDLALVYNSSGDNGFVGVGWNLNGESFIERASSSGGAPTYASGDIFALDGTELLPCTTFGGTHCTKHQNYERIQQDTANNAWYVWEKDGTKKTYTWRYCIANCVNPTFDQIFRWALATVQDTNGNTVTYNYWCEPAQNCYLDNIAYNGATIKLWREPRPDEISFTNGVYVGRTNYRLKTIEVLVGGARASAYGLSYKESTDTGRSLLRSVQEYGRDAILTETGAVTGGTALPAMAMEYTTNAQIFTDRGQWLTDWCKTPGDLQLGDFNGDGKTDLFCHSTNESNYVALSTGSSFADKGIWLADWCRSTGKTQVGDFNADGLTDLLCHSSNESNYVALSTGTAFADKGIWLADWCKTPGSLQTGDFNGDGKTDLLCHSANESNYVALSTGSGFADKGIWLADWCKAPGSLQTGDFNGDGKPDLFCHSTNESNYVALSTGSDFADKGIWLADWCRSTGTTQLGDFNADGLTDVLCHSSNESNYVALSTGSALADKGIWLADWCKALGILQTDDFNADGKTDLFCHSTNESNYVAFSTGSDFASKGIWLANWCRSTGKPLLGDVNGDGKSDVVCHSSNESNYVAQAGDTTDLSDLLTAMTNGQGGTTTVEYTPSSTWPSKNAPRGGNFPTVVKVTVADGRSVSGVTTYSYADAQFSHATKAFFGFRYQKAVVDAQGTTIETYNRQTVQSVGQPEAVYTRNSAGALYAYTTYTYLESGDGATMPYTSLISESSDFECNLTALCRETRTTFVYDAYGNQTQVVDYGDAALAGDERTKVSIYHYNTTQYLVDLPQVERVYRGADVIEANKVDETRYYYDGASDPATAPILGNLTRTDSWDNQTGGYVWTSGQYDQYGNLVAFTDTRGTTETATFDPVYHQFPIQSCNALNHCTTRVWDYVLGAVTAITDANGATTQATYDALGRQTGETDPAGNVTTWQFFDVGDPNKQRVRVTLPDGSVDGLWTDTYTDGLGRPYKVVKEGSSTDVTYRQETVYRDGGKNPQQVSLWYQAGVIPRWETYDYDGAGRLVKTTHADNTFTTITYTNDANGKPYTISLDELGHEHAAWTDTTEHVTLVREKNGAEYYHTRYSYDAVGNLIQVIDQNNNTTSMTYDSLGRKTAMTDMDLGAWHYAYDAGGLLLSQTDAKGQTSTFTYDALGRMTAKTAGGQTTTWYYDEPGYGASMGRLTRIIYPEGSESHTWNNLGLETATTRTVGTIAKTTSTTYDALDRLRTLTYPDGEPVTYSYAADGQLASVSGYVNTMTWSPNGQLTQITYANGTTTDYTYDPNRLWLKSATMAKGAVPLYSATYDYNAASLVTSETQGTPTPRTVNYTYDDLNRLTAASGAQNQTFTYDAVGNMTNNSLVGAYSYGDPAHKHAVTTAGAVTYTYDANGNMLTGSGKTFAWDAENRLTAVTQGATVTTFAYAAGEQRIKKTQTTTVQTAAQQNPVTQSAMTLYLPLIAGSGSLNGTQLPNTGSPGTGDSQGTVTTLYFGNLVEEANGSPIQYYYAGPLLVAKKDADGAKSWYHADRLGSIRLMTDASGVAANRYDYQPFGEQQASAVTVRNERGFTGHIADAETGLTYMVARYYDAGLGRFLSADTVVGQPYDPQDLNRYSYVNNNPINKTDPTGHTAGSPADLRKTEERQRQEAKRRPRPGSAGELRWVEEKLRKETKWRPRPGSAAELRWVESKLRVDSSTRKPHNPKPDGRFLYQYDFAIEQRHWFGKKSKVKGQPYDVFEELYRCFNCNFPIKGAPRSFPRNGDDMPLQACFNGFRPCRYAPVKIYTNSANQIQIVAQPGHFDGSGSSLLFTFYTDKRGYLHMTVTARVTGKLPVPAPIYKNQAHQAWVKFAQNLGGNLDK